MRSRLNLQTTKKLIVAILIVIMQFLAACSLLPGQDTTVDSTPEQTRTAAVFPTITPTVAPTVTPTSTPEPTPIAPEIRVSDQEVGEDGVFTIDEAALPQAGWLAVFSVDGETTGELLGYVDLPEGVHQNIRVTIDPFQATETLLAQLHWNAGDPQEFELPDPDLPMSAAARAEFSVDVTLPQASVAVEDQTLTDDGVVTVNAVSALDATWVVIHADDNGAAGAVLGQVLLNEPGEYEDVAVPIRWQQGTPQLHAVLHEDNGEKRYFDFPDADQPLVANGSAIATPFAATFPPEVLVYDQPVIDGKVTIERVISNGPGWVVVQFDDNGQPGLIIGESPLQDGLNQQVEVDLIEEAKTPTLFARIHQDTAPGDDFEFPEADPPVMFDGRLPQAQSFRTDAGSYIIIYDQPVTEESEITASVVMATNNGWLVIHADEDGAPGAVLGQTFVTIGINRDVVIALDSTPSPGRFHAILYQDAGEPQVFEFPGGPDSPFRVQGGVVDVPFQIGSLNTDS